MGWQDILKIDIQGLIRTYPALRGLPERAIREFSSRINSPMGASININRLISQLKERYGVGRSVTSAPQPAVGAEATRQFGMGRLAKNQDGEEAL
tara:strand:- start:156 stop:440 length:285 start_codon:yes stop_codon:yes gene_type:complete